MNAARSLRYARRKAALSQRELAEKSGVPQPSIARIERGTSIPRVDTLDRLLRTCGMALEVSPSLGIDEDPTLFSLDLAPAERAAAAVQAGRAIEQLRARTRTA